MQIDWHGSIKRANDWRVDRNHQRLLIVAAHQFPRQARDLCHALRGQVHRQADTDTGLFTLAFGDIFGAAEHLAGLAIEQSFEQLNPKSFGGLQPRGRFIPGAHAARCARSAKHDSRKVVERERQFELRIALTASI